MYVERDYRRQTPGKAETTSHTDYLMKCLDSLISHLTEMVPVIASKYVVFVLYNLSSTYIIIVMIPVVNYLSYLALFVMK